MERDNVKVIAVDVDLTVVDSFTPWMEWFEWYSGGVKVTNADGAYDLVPEMKQILKRVGREDVDPFAFWRKPYLYDDMLPLPGSVRALNRLSDAGHKVLFVSSCAPEHTASKIRFLDKWFGWRSGFIATHQKEYVAYDVLIDDKLQHLRFGQEFRPNSRHILFTGVRPDSTAETRAKFGFEEMDNWVHLYTKLGF